MERWAPNSKTLSYLRGGVAAYHETYLYRISVARSSAICYDARGSVAMRAFYAQVELFADRAERSLLCEDTA